MGAWSTDIMGSDDALDVADTFEDEFGESGVVPAEKSEELAASLVEGYQTNATTVVAWKVMERHSPMTASFKAAVIKGLEEEIAEVSGDNSMGWGNPEERVEHLKGFRDLVGRYPLDGGSVLMPEQRGLMDTIFGGISS